MWLYFKAKLSEAARKRCKTLAGIAVQDGGGGGGDIPPTLKNQQWIESKMIFPPSNIRKEIKHSKRKHDDDFKPVSWQRHFILNCFLWVFLFRKFNKVC